MQLKKSGLVLSLLLATLTVSACSSRKPVEKIVTKTEYRERQIEQAAPIKPISLNDVQVYVVSEKNLDQFLAKMQEQDGQLAIIALTVRGYENLSLNVSELERYIRQQKEVIVYYEEAIKPSDTKAPQK
jgi:flavin-dependent dehydrogenase